ncbi:MAG TPA: C40 family peptidase [Solimonas sp.]
MSPKKSSRRFATLLLTLAALGFWQSAAALTLSDQLGQAAAFEVEATESIEPSSLRLMAAYALDLGRVTGIVTREALAMIGADYELGSQRDDAIDCSGLVQRVFGAAGVDMPRTTREQVNLGKPVAARDLKKGDLVFYQWQRRQLHVAIYMDEGYILHASPAAGRVVLTRLTPSWQARMVGARRLI